MKRHARIEWGETEWVGNGGGVGLAELGKRLRARAEDSFLAEDLDMGLPRIEIVGDRRVTVENHKGIVEYSDTLMRIACGRLQLRITGAGLELCALSLSEVSVTGKIISVEYIG